MVCWVKKVKIGADVSHSNKPVDRLTGAGSNPLRLSIGQGVFWKPVAKKPVAKKPVDVETGKNKNLSSLSTGLAL